MDTSGASNLPMRPRKTVAWLRTTFRNIAKASLSDYASVQDYGTAIVEAGKSLKDAGHPVEPWILSCCLLDGLPDAYSRFKDEQYAKLAEISINPPTIQYNDFGFNIASHGGVEVLLKLLLREQTSTAQGFAMPASNGSDEQHERGNIFAGSFRSQHAGNREDSHASPDGLFGNIPSNGVNGSSRTRGLFGNISSNSGAGAPRAGTLFGNFAANGGFGGGGDQRAGGLFGRLSENTSNTGTGSQGTGGFFGGGFGHTTTSGDGNQRNGGLFGDTFGTATHRGDGNPRTESIFGSSFGSTFANGRDTGDRPRPDNAFNAPFGNVSSGVIGSQRTGSIFESFAFNNPNLNASLPREPTTDSHRNNWDHNGDRKSALILNIALIPAICHHLSPKDIARMSKVSKHLKDAVEPTLYEDVEFRPSSTFGGSPHRSFCLLLRSIINRPALASHVKSLKLWGSGWMGDQQSHLGWSGNFSNFWKAPEGTGFGFGNNVGVIDKKIFTNDEYAALKVAVQSLCPPKWAATYLDELEGGNWDILCAVLLSRLSNLKSLDLDTAFQRLTVFLCATSEESLDLPPPCQRFPVLESVRLNSEASREGSYHRNQGRVGFYGNLVMFNSIHVTSLIGLPSIKSLSMCVPKDTTMCWPPNSSITSLAFTQSHLSIKVLGRLLSATPSLKQLEYHRLVKDSFEFFGQSNPELITCKDLRVALAKVASTLEVLNLSFGVSQRADDMNRSGFKGIRPMFGLLHGFKALQSVVIPITLFLDPELDLGYSLAASLPPSVRRVCLTDDLCDLGTRVLSPKLKPWVEEFVLGERQTHAPDLGKFTVEYRAWLKTSQSQTADCHAMHGEWCKGQGQMQWSEGHRLVHISTGR